MRPSHSLHSRLSLTLLACSSVVLLSANTASGAALKEEIIEPQKKIETVNETPISVKVVTGEDFLALDSFKLEDLSRITAGLGMVPGPVPDIHVRGAGSVTRADVSLRTNIYQDGVLVEQPRALFDTQFDLQRFEILRGPQGTLYGKASPAGTINIRTNSPNMKKIDGYVSTSAAEYDALNTQFGVSLPIIENKLSVRLAGVYDENKETGQKLVTTGQEAQSRSKAGRIIIAWQPTSDFDARLAYNYRERTNDPWLNTSGGGYKADDDKVTLNYPSNIHSRDQLTSLEMNQTLSDHLALVSITGYEKQLYSTITDQDNTISPAGLQFIDFQIDPTWQQDLRLLSEDNDFWDWQIGIFYLRTHVQVPVNLQIALGGPTPFTVTSESLSNREDHAIYTHNTFKLTDQLNLIVGLRYQESRANLHQPIGFNGGTPHDAIDPSVQHISNYAPTGTVKLQYFFTPDLAGYVSLDHANRAGSSSSNGSGTLPTEFYSIKPEDSNSAELGLKGNFWNQRGRFSAALFDQTYTDFQLDMTNLKVAASSSPISSFVANAKKAETRGIEFSLGLLPLDNWEINTGLTLIDAKYKDFKNDPCNPVGGQTIPVNPGYLTCDLSGERLSSTSRWSGNLYSRYSLPLTAGLEWYASGLVQAQSSQIDALTRQSLGGYATVDLFTGVHTGSAKSWDVSLWVKNAFNRRAITSVGQTPTSPLANGYVFVSYDAVTTNLPRQVGATGVYRFN